MYLGGGIDVLQQKNTQYIYFRSCIFSCMSQKAELPSLTGHRTKTRKRDEKKVKEILLCKD